MKIVFKNGTVVKTNDKVIKFGKNAFVMSEMHWNQRPGSTAIYINTDEVLCIVDGFSLWDWIKGALSRKM